MASGGAGDDYLVGGSDAEVLTGGGDKDLIVAGDGADNIWGDANAASITRDWALARSVVQDGDSTNYVTGRACACAVVAMWSVNCRKKGLLARSTSARSAVSPRPPVLPSMRV